jgi:hypothetical protein
MAPVTPSTRASDAEREKTSQRLREHAAAGRLTMDELSERLDRTYAARTQGELSELVVDLPSPSRSVRRRHPALRGQLHAYLLVNLMLIVVWAATGADYFWPLWPLLGWGIGLITHARGRPHRSVTRA